MILLRFAALFPDAIGRRVAGLVIANSTPTNPARTTAGKGFIAALQKPILEPLLYLTIAVFPLVWLMNWLSFQNGSLHIVTKLLGFAGRDTRGQLDYAAKLTAKARPSVLARGALGMFRYDGSEAIGEFRVPVLIIAGDRDRGTIPEVSRHMAERIPGSELLELKPSGHLSVFEQNEAFMARVDEFARGLDVQTDAVAIADDAVAVEAPRAVGDAVAAE